VVSINPQASSTHQRPTISPAENKLLFFTLTKKNIGSLQGAPGRWMPPVTIHSTLINEQFDFLVLTVLESRAKIDCSINGCSKGFLSFIEDCGCPYN
jgi:hypothetical protein